MINNSQKISSGAISLRAERGRLLFLGGVIFWGHFSEGKFSSGAILQEAISAGGAFLGGHIEHRKARDLDAANQPQSFSKDVGTSASNYSILIGSLLLLFCCGRKILGVGITG